METVVDKQIIFERNLLIESITLLDGVTPDEEVQYKVGRNVDAVVKEEYGQLARVFYNWKRFWDTFEVQHVENTSDKLIVTDIRSIYTFSKVRESEEHQFS